MGWTKSGLIAFISAMAVQAVAFSSTMTQLVGDGYFSVHIGGPLLNNAAQLYVAIVLASIAATLVFRIDDKNPVAIWSLILGPVAAVALFSPLFYSDLGRLSMLAVAPFTVLCLGLEWMLIHSIGRKRSSDGGNTPFERRRAG